MRVDLNTLYNLKYVTILPKFDKRLYSIIEETIGNVIVIETGDFAKIEEIITFLNKNNIEEIIFIDYLDEYKSILSLAKKEYKVKFIFTPNIGKLSDALWLYKFNEMIKLYKTGVAEELAFYDQNLYDMFKEDKNIYKLDMNIKGKNESISLKENNTIGILNDGSSFYNSFYNALSAVGLLNKTAKIRINSFVQDFLNVFDIKYVKSNSKDDLFENEINVNINFSGDVHPEFFESMNAGIPCIIGNNDIIQNNELLEKYLVVKSDDNIDEIASKIKQAIENKQEIIAEYRKFKRDYDKKANEKLNNFLKLNNEKRVVEKDEKLLSIVFPVYNTEKYIENSIDSVIEAVNGRDDIELLIINDGSKDKSENIINEYKDKYPNLITYVKQENKGLGNVRNVGVLKAKGKYIASVDSDDTINKNLFSETIEYLENDIDLVVFDWLSIIEKKDEKYITSAIEISPQNATTFESILYSTIMPSACNKIIKKEIFKKYDIKFLEDKFEDLSAIPVVLLNSKSIKYINKPYYEYKIREGSIMRSDPLIKTKSMIKAIKYLNNLIKEKYDVSNSSIELEKVKFFTYSWRIEDFIFNPIFTEKEKAKNDDIINLVYEEIYEIILDLFNSKYYKELLDTFDKDKKEYFIERNNYFKNKDLDTFIKNKDKYYYINSMDVYNYGNSTN